MMLVALKQVALKLECTVKHPENVDFLVGLYRIGDPIVPLEQDADVTVTSVLVAMADIGVLDQDLCPVEDALKYSRRGGGVVGGNVLMDVFLTSARLRPSSSALP